MKDLPPCNLYPYTKDVHVYAYPTPEAAHEAASDYLRSSDEERHFILARLVYSVYSNMAGIHSDTDPGMPADGIRDVFDIVRLIIWLLAVKGMWNFIDFDEKGWGLPSPDTFDEYAVTMKLIDDTKKFCDRYGLKNLCDEHEVMRMYYIIEFNDKHKNI